MKTLLNPDYNFLKNIYYSGFKSVTKYSSFALGSDSALI